MRKTKKDSIIQMKRSLHSGYQQPIIQTRGFYLAVLAVIPFLLSA